MSEIVERVAKAIYGAEGDGRSRKEGYDFWQNLARAAIAAMREPTNEMLIAAGFDGTSDLEKWHAMIDEALR